MYLGRRVLSITLGELWELASSHFHKISSNPRRLFAFIKALPVAFLAPMAIVDFFRVTGLLHLSCVENTTNTLCHPFRQFLVLDDLAQLDRASAPRLEPSQWRKTAITVAFILQVVFYGSGRWYSARKGTRPEYITFCCSRVHILGERTFLTIDHQ